MQDMLKNMMGEMWKNVGNTDAMNWAKDMNMPNDLNPTKIGLQVLGYQKKTIDGTFEAVAQMQEKAEEMAKPLLKNNPIPVPEEWSAMLKNNQDAFKKSIDDGFAKVAAYFTDVADNGKKETKKAEK